MRQDYLTSVPPELASKCYQVEPATQAHNVYLNLMKRKAKNCTTYSSEARDLPVGCIFFGLVCHIVKFEAAFSTRLNICASVQARYGGLPCANFIHFQAIQPVRKCLTSRQGLRLSLFHLPGVVDIP
jgi:hypothetical protein